MINEIVDLREEWEALSPKIDKIATFLNSEEFNSLSPKDKAICQWTDHVMRAYHVALRDIICASKCDLSSQLQMIDF